MSLAAGAAHAGYRFPAQIASDRYANIPTAERLGVSYFVDDHLADPHLTIQYLYFDCLFLSQHPGSQQATILAQVGHFYFDAVGQYYSGANGYKTSETGLLCSEGFCVHNSPIAHRQGLREVTGYGCKTTEAMLLDQTLDLRERR